MAFDLAVPDSLFLVRTESGGDYGTDLLLEAKYHGKMTNFRCQVQIKSIHCPEYNSDGSVSYPMSVASINYLLHQPNSVFAVYLEDQKSFRWAWVDEINLYAEDNGIDLLTTAQQTVTYRFFKHLSQETFLEIHKRIIQSGLESVEKVRLCVYCEDQVAATVLKVALPPTLSRRCRIIPVGGPHELVGVASQQAKLPRFHAEDIKHLFVWDGNPTDAIDAEMSRWQSQSSGAATVAWAKLPGDSLPEIWLIQNARTAEGLRLTAELLLRPVDSVQEAWESIRELDPHTAMLAFSARLNVPFASMCEYLSVVSRRMNPESFRELENTIRQLLRD